MAFEVINSAEIAAGEPVTNGLWTKVKNSLDSLKASVDAATSVLPIIITNDFKHRDPNELPVGTIVWGSIATTLNQSGAISEFGATNNGDWRLCNGQSITGTDYATAQTKTTTPDLRGKFIRMINHSSGINPDGEKAQDSVTSWKTDTLSHTHQYAHTHGVGHTHTLSHTHGITHGHGNTLQSSSEFAYNAHSHGSGTFHAALDSTSSAAIYIKTYTTGVSFTSTYSYPLTRSSSAITRTTGVDVIGTSSNNSSGGTVVLSGSVTDYSGSTSSQSLSETSGPSVSNTSSQSTTTTGAPSSTANETAPYHLHENAFIKVNEDYLKTEDGFKVWKVTKQMELTDVIVTPDDDYNGTGGTFELDVQYLNQATLDMDSGSWTSLLSGGTAQVTGGTGQSASSPTVDATTLNVGWWLKAKIVQVATKQKAIHIYIAGEPA